MSVYVCVCECVYFLRTAGAVGAYYGPGWWHTNLYPLEDSGARTTIAANNWKLTDSEGYAVRSEEETGDWHMFAPASVKAGDAPGYGNWGSQAENGGRFFTTSAMVWEAVGAPWAPYPTMLAEWKRVVNNLVSVGAQIAANDTRTPLLAGDPHFLSLPVTDPLVNYLCAKVRAQFNFPNVTDLWGHHLCEYYQDLGWGTPENGVALYSFAKGLLGVRVSPGGKLAVLGASSVVSPRMQPWVAKAQLPAGWPSTISRVSVNFLTVGGASVDVSCAAAGPLLTCNVYLSPGCA